MNRKPYLDKFTSSTQTTPNPPGCTEFNTVTNFPSLKHCGIKSRYEPDETATTDPEGKITMKYRFEAKRTLMPLYRGEIKLNTREEIFRRSHKQFIDKVLLDMESKKQTQLERRMKHWGASKSKLGFTDTFNSLDFTSFQPVHEPVVADDYYADEFESPPSSSPTQYEQALPTPTVHPPPSHPPAHPLALTSSLPGDSIEKLFSAKRKKNKLYNRLKVFEELIDTVPPPREGKSMKRYGTLVIPTSPKK